MPDEYPHGQERVGTGLGLVTQTLRHVAQVIGLNRQILEISQVVQQHLHQLHQLAYLLLRVEAIEKFDEVTQFFAALA